MPRAPFNVVVYPFRVGEDGAYQYALLRRADEGWWQGVSGGGEEGESPLEAAVRETAEETRISVAADAFIAPDAIEPVPAPIYRDSPAWGEAVYVVPQYGFGCPVESPEIALSREHAEFRWASSEQASSLLRYNRIPLWELNARLLGGGPRSGPKPP
ncbi:MAG: NUDIX domain-containing protein [Dehalococcoidia bacterium]|nr:MAG: NUDIX domain-containing protein [Dehalococcoidia bacterium]